MRTFIRLKFYSYYFEIEELKIDRYVNNGSYALVLETCPFYAVKQLGLQEMLQNFQAECGLYKFVIILKNPNTMCRMSEKDLSQNLVHYKIIKTLKSFFNIWEQLYTTERFLYE